MCLLLGLISVSLCLPDVCCMPFWIFLWISPRRVLSICSHLLGSQVLLDPDKEALWSPGWDVLLDPSQP